MSMLKKTFEAIRKINAQEDANRRAREQGEKNAYAKIYTPVVQEFINDLKALNKATKGVFAYNIEEDGYKENNPLVTVIFGSQFDVEQRLLNKEARPVELRFNDGGSMEAIIAHAEGSKSTTYSEVTEANLASFLGEKLKEAFKREELSKIQKKLHL